MFLLADNFKFHWGENHDMLVELVSAMGEIRIKVTLTQRITAETIL